MPATLPITVGSSDCDPGGFQARGVQAFDIDGILLTWNGETWQALTSPQTRQMQALVSGAGIPSAFSSRALTDADNGATLICAGSQTATVNAGRVAGFGCSFKGAISFNGTAAVNDVRTTGAANPWCALVQIGTDTYDAVGGKA